MKFHNPTAELFVPDGLAVAETLPRTTHLGIGAHQDDLEFMAFHGILACYHSTSQWFGGITCTNGGGSSRIGPYARFSDAEMMAVRRREQNAAAIVGEYSFMAQLDHPSKTIKGAGDSSLKADLKLICAAMRPEIVYTHNLADKHDTHVAVAVNVIQAVRELPPANRPRALWGCEVWRNLDWMLDTDKTLLDTSNRENLAAALGGLFDSQIAGGKRYDLAVLGRRRANATFLESHATDNATQLSFAMDLTPLIQDNPPAVTEYVDQFIRRFRDDVRDRLQRQLGS